MGRGGFTLLNVHGPVCGGDWSKVSAFWADIQINVCDRTQHGGWGAPGHHGHRLQRLARPAGKRGDQEVLGRLGRCMHRVHAEPDTTPTHKRAAPTATNWTHSW